MAQISKTIGSTFGDEVLASEVAGLPFSWGPNGVFWTDAALTTAQVASLTALVNAHDPKKKQPRRATGKRLTEALSNLGLLAAWDAAAAASKKVEDRYYWMSSYRDRIPENNAKIGRIAAATGVTVSTLFDKAVIEPAA